MWRSPLSLTGYDLALEGGVLRGLREWVITRLRGASNLAWPGLVLRAACPEGPTRRQRFVPALPVKSMPSE